MVCFLPLRAHKTNKASFSLFFQAVRLKTCCLSPSMSGDVKNKKPFRRNERVVKKYVC